MKILSDPVTVNRESVRKQPLDPKRNCEKQSGWSEKARADDDLKSGNLPFCD